MKGSLVICNPQTTAPSAAVEADQSILKKQVTNK